MIKQTVLLALIPFALFHTGKCHTPKSTQLIEVPEGDDLPLQCETNPRTDLKEYTMDLKRVDGNSSYTTRVIYSRRNAREYPFPQPEQYRNRVLLINEDLRRGFMTVLIRSVQQSDSGQYKSYIPKLNTACFFNIVVKEKQNWTKENDTSTTATLAEKMPDANPATEKRHHYVLIPVFVLFIAAVLMLFMKRICKTPQRKSEGKDFDLETQGIKAKGGDEEEQLKNLSAVDC